MAPEKEYETEPGGRLIGQAVAGAAEQAEKLAGSIDQKIDLAVESVADGIETSTEYLRGRGVAGMVEDVETLIRRYPLQALLIGLSLGYLFTRSRQR